MGVCPFVDTARIRPQNVSSFAAEKAAGQNGGNVKKIWIPLVIVAVLVGAYVSASAVFEGKARQELAALKAKGFPVTPADLAARYGSGVNPTGRMLNDAAAQIDRKPRLTIADVETSGVRADPAAVSALLKNKSDVIATLLAVADSPPARFGLKYEDGYSARLPEILPKLPAFHALLTIDAHALAEAGRPDSAMRVLRAAVRMADIMGEPWLMSLLASVVGFDSTCTLVVRYAPVASPTSRELIRKELARLDFRELLTRVVASEAVLTEATVLKQGPITGDNGRAGLIPWLKVAPVRNSARYVGLDYVRRNLDALAMPWWQGRKDVESIEKSRSRGGLYSMVAEIAAPNILLFYARMERAAARRGLTLLALDVCDFRSRSGRLPSTLAEIGTDLPADPFTGKPLNYRADASGFTVYSTGMDGADDSGDPAKDLVLRASI